MSSSLATTPRPKPITSVTGSIPDGDLDFRDIVIILPETKSDRSFGIRVGHRTCRRAALVFEKAIQLDRNNRSEQGKQ